jgi:hypothetical protein
MPWRRFLLLLSLPAISCFNYCTQMDRLTIKAQEAIKAAQEVAKGHSNH